MKNANEKIIEYRASRLKQTKQFVESNSYIGLLNNFKWRVLFEWIEENNIPFRLTLLLSKQERKCDWIRELDSTSVLIDDTGDFIEFFEIYKINIERKTEDIEFLEAKKIVYTDTNKDIEVIGYKE